MVRFAHSPRLLKKWTRLHANEQVDLIDHFITHHHSRKPPCRRPNSTQRSQRWSPARSHQTVVTSVGRAQTGMISGWPLASMKYCLTVLKNFPGMARGWEAVHACEPASTTWLHRCRKYWRQTRSILNVKSASSPHPPIPPTNSRHVNSSRRDGRTHATHLVVRIENGDASLESCVMPNLDSLAAGNNSSIRRRKTCDEIICGSMAPHFQSTHAVHHGLLH